MPTSETTSPKDHCSYDADVIRRDTEDGGFSKGWGFHMLPSERYWIDSHCHFRPPHADEGRAAVVSWFERLDAWRLGQFVGVDCSLANLDAYAEIAHDPRMLWLLRLGHDEPDMEACRRAFDLGAGGLKLLNIALICSAGDFHVWESDEWARLFAETNQRKKVVLWHVTQRVTASAYNGGNLHAYWGDGWENGATFSNEDLLQAFLGLVRAYPDISFIGAHQLYLGPDRLGELFDVHPNLYYIDTSVGGIVRWGDEMYPDDRARWRAVATRYCDRILFGTDCDVDTYGSLFEVNVQAFLNHVRFVHQLRLPDDVLQKIAWENCARLYGVEERSSSRRSNVRP